jgi:hypothetical protein
MPDEEQMPAALHPLRKWNAIQLVEEYYEEGLQRLIDALEPQLGAPRTRARADQDRAETERRLRELRGQAESALAVEDWFAGIQALQAAVSLDPNSADLAARLRWAHVQHKSITRRSSVRRWTASAVAAVCLAIVAAGGLVVWVIRSEFAAATSSGSDQANLLDRIASEPAASELAPAAAAPRAAVDPVRTPAPQPAAPDAEPAERRTSGPGFPGAGRWRMTARDNQAMSILLNLENDGSFAVSMPAGVLNLPLSGGRYAYNDSTGALQIMGINNLNAYFSEVIQVFEREDDHFHANYLGSIWELESE